MPDRSQVRVSDAEREATAGALRDHYAAGRIDSDELSGRLDAAYAARTGAELEALLADLPCLPVARSEELARRRPQLRRQLVQEAGGSLTPFAVCVVIWAASGASGSFWPAFALILPILFLLRNGWNLYGPAPDLQRVERELRHGARHGPYGLAAGRGRHHGHRHDRHRRLP